MSLVNRALKKLKATTPMVFGKDARISNEDKLPVVSSKGQKAMMTVGKLLELASKVKEADPVVKEDNEIKQCIRDKLVKGSKELLGVFGKYEITFKKLNDNIKL